MLKSSSKFYAKVQIKSVSFIFMVIGVSYMAIHNNSVIWNSVDYYTSALTFGLMCSAIGILISCVHISGKKYEQLEYLQGNKFNLFKGLVLSSLKIVSFLYLIPLINIIIKMNYNNSFLYNIKGIIHCTIIWYLPNILASVIGSAIGIFVNNYLRYVVSVITFYPFFLGLFKAPSNSVNLLNVFDDKMTIVNNFSSGVIFNSTYILDKLFILVLIGLIIIVTYIFKNSKKNLLIFYISVVIALILCEVAIVNLYKNSYEVRNFNSNEHIISMKAQKNHYCKVNNYKMDLLINNKISNSCNIKVAIIKPNLDQLTFRLDNLLEVKSISINNKNVAYVREHNTLILDLTTFNVQQGDKLDININYEGKLYIENNLGVNSIYTSYTSTNLLYDSLNWYPILNYNENIEYTINIKSTSKMYSNLTINSNSMDKGLFKSNLSGKSRGVNLASGNYMSYTYNNYEIIAPRGLGNINQYIDYSLSDKFNIKKVLVVPYKSGLENIFENTLILNGID